MALIVECLPWRTWSADFPTTTSTPASTPASTPTSTPAPLSPSVTVTVTISDTVPDPDSNAASNAAPNSSVWCRVSPWVLHVQWREISDIKKANTTSRSSGSRPWPSCRPSARESPRRNTSSPTSSREYFPLAFGVCIPFKPAS